MRGLAQFPYHPGVLFTVMCEPVPCTVEAKAGDTFMNRLCVRHRVMDGSCQDGVQRRRGPGAAPRTCSSEGSN